MFAGLRTQVYYVADLDRAKAWWSEQLGVAPYFDEPFYVGFNVGGYELGLAPARPDNPKEKGSITYWGVTNLDEVYLSLLAAGSKEYLPMEEVGEGIKVAAVLDPMDNVVGIIENPHFSLPAAG